MTKVVFWVMTLLLSTALLGCQAPGQRPEGQPGVEQQLKELEQRESVRCESGKEHWRSPTVGRPTRGGVFNIASVSVPNVDMTASPAVFLTALPQVYDTLLQSRACFWEDSTAMPSLAKSWEFSPDGLTLTLKLRDDVRWHNKPPVNGRPFTSADVAFTIDHQRKGGLLRSYWEGLENTQPDAHTVVLRLKEPQADLLANLAYHTNIMVPQEVKEQFSDYKRVAVGTGAYMLEEFSPGQRTRLVRNPNFYLKGQDGQSLPYIEEIRAEYFADPATQIAAMRTGQLDHPQIGQFEKHNADALAQANPKLRIWPGIGARNDGIWFNHKVKPFDDVRIRKAIALSIDFNDIIAGSRRGDAVWAGFVPASLVEWSWSQEKIKAAFKMDRERAKQLLTEAGYGPGQLKLTMMTGSSGVSLQDAEIMQQQFKEVGIEIKLEPDADSTTKQLQGRFSIYASNHYASSFFPDYWLRDLLRSGRSQNILGFSDAKVDALAEAQSREMDPRKRKQLIDQMQDYLLEVMPYVPGVNPVYHRVYSCGLLNMKPPHYHYHLPGIEQAWLDRSGC